MLIALIALALPVFLVWRPWSPSGSTDLQDRDAERVQADLRAAADRRVEDIAGSAGQVGGS
ncbi:MAG: hypothetical protein QOI21_4081 [Actinomycetota bacterium]|jgi:hypothetical protein|nr:hypothetical protein [Actinomycetota bacterium]